MSTDIHFQALCNAIEHERLDKCRSILSASAAPPHRGVDLAAPNNDGFTPLDLAFMTGHRELLRLILSHGGREGTSWPSHEAVTAHLHALIHESKKQVDKFGQLIKAAHSKGGHAPHPAAAQLSQAQLKECEKQQTLWQKRMATLKRLKLGFDGAGCPHAPAQVDVNVVGSDRIAVRLVEAEQMGVKSMLYTKCKVQWSHKDSFSTVIGERIVTDVGDELVFKVGSLVEGQRYFVRASFGNPKGFGPFSASTPKSVVPSTWRSVEDRIPRLQEQLEVSRNTFKAISGDFDEDYEPQKFGKKKGFRNLFSSSSAPKFHRHLSPNKLYLACVFFHEDKVLMTNEEALPVMEVDEEVPPNVSTEFSWLAKLCFILKDAEKLKHEANKINGSSANCRTKLLQSVINMQHALGIVDLGTAFHKPFVHQDGSVILSLVNHIHNPKSLVSLSMKWVPLGKAQRRASFDSQVSPMDTLRYSLREQILFQQVCEIRLGRGLYLCYLQAQSTIDTMSVVVSNTSPSILPYVRVRENPHVTCDEWAWLSKLGRLSSQASSMQVPSPTTNFLAGEGEEGSEVQGHELKSLKPTESQYVFGIHVRQAMERLFDYLEIKPQDRPKHRLYDIEILEITSEISVLLLLPSPESICSVADNLPSLNLQRNDLLLLSIQMFETIHLSVYHNELVTSFYRSMLHLDLDLIVAKQQHREAFSNKELEESQSHLTMLIDLQQGLEESWKPMRWLLDVLSQARNKSNHCGINYEQLCSWYENRPDAPDDTYFVEEGAGKNKNKVFRQDTLSQINATHPYDPLTSTSASGTLTHPVQGGSKSLSRTPTTRSDPLEFNLSSNKENEVKNFPGGSSQPSAVEQQQSSGSGNFKQPTSSSYSSLTFSQHSTNSSISSNENNQQAPQPQQHQYENVQDGKRSFDPRVAQRGRFSRSHSANQDRHQTGGGVSSSSSTPEPNILQVFAAYETGLASGTSVKLNVTHGTSAREVIDLVIKQLNMAVILKGKEGPIYENDKLRNFCLVAVIGSRERCLRDDFKPLNLQNPWKKGKLYVRMKNDLLAAIEHITRHSTML